MHMGLPPAGNTTCTNPVAARASLRSLLLVYQRRSRARSRGGAEDHLGDKLRVPCCRARLSAARSNRRLFGESIYLLGAPAQHSSACNPSMHVAACSVGACFPSRISSEGAHAKCMHACDAMRGRGGADRVVLTGGGARRRSRRPFVRETHGSHLTVIKHATRRMCGVETSPSSTRGPGSFFLRPVVELHLSGSISVVPADGYCL